MLLGRKDTRRVLTPKYNRSLVFCGNSTLSINSLAASYSSMRLFSSSGGSLASARRELAVTDMIARDIDMVQMKGKGVEKNTSDR